jgi:hypothetical protein
VAVADLGDRALAALLAGGVLGGHQADEGHELLAGAEAIEVTDLGDEREPGQRVDPALAAEPRPHLAVAVADERRLIEIAANLGPRLRGVQRLPRHARPGRTRSDLRLH